MRRVIKLKLQVTFWYIHSHVSMKCHEKVLNTEKVIEGNSKDEVFDKTFNSCNRLVSTIYIFGNTEAVFMTCFACF